MNVVSLKDFLKWTIMDFFLIVQKKKKETVVLILFEIQHPLHHWLAGDLDRG
jgi:hypothetical protein